VSCCNKNKPCDNKKEELSMGPSLDVIAQLIEIARTGDLTKLISADATVRELATTIIKLAADLNLFKKVAKKTDLAVAVTHTDVLIKFGPDNVYALTLPAVTGEQRAILSQQFRAAADQLSGAAAMTYAVPQQMQFQFIEVVK
jgi:hypothetical protein